MSEDETAAPAEAPSVTEEPPRRRKKRQRSASPAPDSVPAFARAFPREPTLDGLVLAFEAGDYARVRREAPRLARETDRDDVRAAARELVKRLDPDPLAAYLLWAGFLLLGFLAAWYWLHPHAG